MKSPIGAYKRSANHRRTALFAAAAGALVLSTSGLLVRSIESAESWQIIFFRAVGLCFGLCGVFLIRHQREVAVQIRNSWKAAMLVGPFQAAASIFFILALTKTSVANAMLPMSAVPLLSAGLGWFLLGETLRHTTFFALISTVLGVALMTVGGFVGGTPEGAIYGLLSAVLFSVYLVIVRRATRSSGQDLLSAVVFGAFLGGCFAAALMPSFGITAWDLVISLGWGSIIQCAGVSCLVFSARHLHAAELSMLTSIEAAIGPLLVWLVMAEVPGCWTIIGGSIVLAAVALWGAEQIIRDWRTDRIADPSSVST